MLISWWLTPVHRHCRCRLEVGVGVFGDADEGKRGEDGLASDGGAKRRWCSLTKASVPESGEDNARRP